jgi:hypothetical protein
MKTCPKCGKTKKISEWSKNKKRHDGLQSWCKECMYEKQKIWRNKNKEKWKSYSRKYYYDDVDKYRKLGREQHLRSNYNMTFECYNKMFKNQKGKCAICKTSDSSAGRGDRFYIDHCHETGKVRGLLCHYCNASLGGFRDDIKILKTAIRYLKKHDAH